MKSVKIVSASIDKELWEEFCLKIEDINKGRKERKVTRSSIFEEAIIKFIRKRTKK